MVPESNPHRVEKVLGPGAVCLMDTKRALNTQGGSSGYKVHSPNISLVPKMEGSSSPIHIIYIYIYKLYGWM